jgi:hypothetical protein
MLKHSPSNSEPDGAALRFEPLTGVPTWPHLLDELGYELRDRGVVLDFERISFALESADEGLHGCLASGRVVSVA